MKVNHRENRCKQRNSMGSSNSRVKYKLHSSFIYLYASAMAQCYELSIADPIYTYGSKMPSSLNKVLRRRLKYLCLHLLVLALSYRTLKALKQGKNCLCITKNLERSKRTLLNSVEEETTEVLSVFSLLPKYPCIHQRQ